MNQQKPRGRGRPRKQRKTKAEYMGLTEDTDSTTMSSLETFSPSELSMIGSVTTNINKDSSALIAEIETVKKDVNYEAEITGAEASDSKKTDSKDRGCNGNSIQAEIQDKDNGQDSKLETNHARATVDKKELIQKLEKNSTVSVNVDDVNEGLVVVSFSHNNNIYQGVLFQINRERGIPCGISFPNGAVPGIVSNDVDCGDPNQVPPLLQRDTYFQDKSPKPKLALRRFIKPPSRYKNAKLRQRSRPFLCARCRVFCDEIAAASNGNQTPCSSPSNRPTPCSPATPSSATLTPDTTPTEKKSAPVTANGGGGVTTRRGWNRIINAESLSKNGSATNSPGEGASASTTPNSVKEKDGAHTPAPDTPKSSKPNRVRRKTKSEVIPFPLTNEDYSYTVAGSVGVVESFWKRPSGEDLSIDNNNTAIPASSKTSIQSMNSTLTTVAKVTLPKLNLMSICDSQPATSKQSPNRAGETKPQSNNSLLVKALTAPFKNTKRAPGEKLSSETFETKSKSIQLLVEKLIVDKAGSNKMQVDNFISDNSPSSSPSRKSSEDVYNIFGSGKKRNRTVPARYRDPSYLTKTGGSEFKKRRVPENDMELNNLYGYRSEELCKSSAKGGSEASTCKIVGPSSTKDSDEDAEIYSSTSTLLSNNTFAIAGTSNSSGYGSTSATNASSTSGKTQDISNVSGQKEVVPKTPSIKITFGSSGKGVVLQIPPKVTQKSPSTSSVTSEQPSSSKAARKAMKKAKKEAKKQRSMSLESTSAWPNVSHDAANDTETSTVSSSSANSTSSAPNDSCSPSPPILNREYPIVPYEHYFGGSIPSAMKPPLDNDPFRGFIRFPFIYPPVPDEGEKKKKTKHQKRSKESRSSSKTSDSSSSSPELESRDNNFSNSSSTRPYACTEEEFLRLCAKTESSSDDDEEEQEEEDGLELRAPVLQNEVLESKKHGSINEGLDDMSHTSCAAQPADQQQRLCISLKRLDANSNAYVSCTSQGGATSGTVAKNVPDRDRSSATFATVSKIQKKYRHRRANPKARRHVSTANNETAVSANSTERNNNSEASDSDFATYVKRSPEYDENFDSYKSFESCTVGAPPCTFTRGDIIWGKLAGCPWWPGKILDILHLHGDGDNIRVKVSWYQATTTSFIRLSSILPFEDNFESKYNKTRRRGTYKQAVREALIEVHSLNPEDLPVSD